MIFSQNLHSYLLDFKNMNSYLNKLNKGLIYIKLSHELDKKERELLQYSILLS